MAYEVSGVSAGLLSQVSPYGYEESLTPEGLMLYLSDRLNGLDDQVNVIFAKQEATEAARSALRKITQELSNLKDEADAMHAKIAMPGISEDPKLSQSVQGGAANTEKRILAALDELEAVDPAFGAEVRGQLRQSGQILAGMEGWYRPSEVKASTQYLENKLKDLEAEAQIGMIHLQSLMSNRQTAIQLSTNLISSLGESHKAIASNIGR